MLLLQGRISPHQNMTLCVISRVRFERNYGKMYSRHLFPYSGLLTDATATTTSLKKRICLLSDCIAIIHSHLRCQMQANPPELEFPGTMYKFRKRKKIPSLLVYVLHKTRNQAFSRGSRAKTAKKCTKNRDARAALLFCRSKPIVFQTLSSPSSCWILKSLILFQNSLRK